LLDLMCGPGYLLGKISSIRKDLLLQGVDISYNYIDYAKKRYHGINFEIGNVRLYEPKKRFDMVVCTGALHHIPYEKQSSLIDRMVSMTKPGGRCIISDCYIDDYSDEIGRKLAAAKLGYEYLKETMKNGAPKEIIASLIDILQNDVMMDEFKTSLKKRLSLLEKVFKIVKVLKTWPETESQYGDYCILLKPKFKL
jgi:2-polyprenyl-3-methyl-5-hydroxy-6-metoxy-1,4-benzoquinol methylase